MTPSLIQTLRAHAHYCRTLAEQIISPVTARRVWLDAAQACDDAAALLAADAYAAPVEELRGTAPLIVYFGSEHDRADFERVLAIAKPNMRPRAL
jgi:hypothetical protein